MTCEINDLPDELLEYILSLTSPYKDLQKCKLVSKRWCRATRNVMKHNEAHFQKSVAFGSLLWNSWPLDLWPPVIGKRHSHSACTYENAMYVFGGCTAACTTFNDLWRLDLDTREWARPITRGSYPSPKACATMLHYKKSFILFGGWSHPSPYPYPFQQWKLFNELHVYSIESNKWSAINTLEKPPPTSAHSASIHGNLMVIFGGVCNGYSSNDVWCLNLDTYSWHKQATSNVKPQPRYGQSQVELGEKHLLILGGCTGPNVAMNDAWLLEMEGPTWTWRKVNMQQTMWAPTRIWCHQACKVGNSVIVLGKNKRQAKRNDMSISIKGPCPRAISTRPPNPLSVHKRPRSVSEVDRDENVNGRHGSFLRSHSQESNSVSYNSNVSKALPLFGENALSMAAFRDDPLRSNPSGIRQRQLETLRRLEEKLQSRRTQRKPTKKTENTLSIFVLDISNVLHKDSSASWVQLKSSNESGPDERILYSLVVGRGELIVFGGIRKEQTLSQGYPNVDDSEVYNDLHFINPPRYVI